MSQVKSVELEDGTVILIESDEDVTLPDVQPGKPSGEESLVSKGVTDTAVEQFQSVQETVKAYTNHVLDAFKGIAGANVDNITLEFGVKVGGEAGIPYITKGTAESNLKITVQCSFPGDTPTSQQTNS